MSDTTVRRANQPRTNTKRHVPGEVGVWVFILGDMVIFAILFMTYLQARGQQTQLFDNAQPELNQNYGAVNTVLLLVSSLFVVLAVSAVRAGNPLASKLILGALACGLAFSVLKAVEYVDKTSHGITPATNDFFMYYFVLTGLHWFHLILGLGVLSRLYILARKSERTKGQELFIEGGACFWHMVDLLWIVLFPLLYLVAS